jgi:hypothetical protein
LCFVRDKKVVGVFVRFRAPLQVGRTLEINLIFYALVITLVRVLLLLLGRYRILGVRLLQIKQRLLSCILRVFHLDKELQQHQWRKRQLKHGVK